MRTRLTNCSSGFWKKEGSWASFTTFKKHGDFEVIEVTDGYPLVREGTFIGFDLSAGYNNSLLAPGLAPLTHPVDLSEPVLESYELISRNFAPQLNRHGLFDTFETADLCFRAMNALQQLSPNFFEWATSNLPAYS